MNLPSTTLGWNPVAFSSIARTSTSVTPRYSIRNSAWLVNERSQLHQSGNVGIERFSRADRSTPRRDRELGVLPQPVVEHDDPQRVQQLPLVLVDPLGSVGSGGRGRRASAAPATVRGSRLLRTMDGRREVLRLRGGVSERSLGAAGKEPLVGPVPVRARTTHGGRDAVLRSPSQPRRALGLRRGLEAPGRAGALRCRLRTLRSLSVRYFRTRAGLLARRAVDRLHHLSGGERLALPRGRPRPPPAHLPAAYRKPSAFLSGRHAGCLHRPRARAASGAAPGPGRGRVVHSLGAG